MASLGMGYTTLPAAKAKVTAAGRARRPAVAVALATKGAAAAGAKAEEKGLLDWILGGLQKDDQLLETDPILNKVQAQGSSSVSVKSKPAAPNSGGGTFGGFGGLFAKK
ncbi:hypothetical protein LUZ62_034312 [Rhynchospora pubera]|uniref:Thylakoid soluble phosphoprotein TSP9 n=1 Tax=Rhynchospora pubera TaxID=906938 RepID=A0AAV8DIF2_9POAL|nr:hypothetical protein LUZ62_079378 [Rhynchospora pubera]KAJ4821746.1 hypothetical protein LUZ62_034312 [Rhynchospora pubera]